MLTAAVILAVAAYLLLPTDPNDRLGRMTAGQAQVAKDPVREWAMGVQARLMPARARARDRNQCLRALDALAAELAAGMPPHTALLQVDDDVLAHAIAAARLHGSIPSALRRDAERIPALAPLAGAWQAAERHGAPLAPIVISVSADMRASIAVQRELDAELASAQASFRVLSLLPVVGLAFGIVMGASPLAWLVGTSFGRIALTAGVLLMLLGAAWMHLLVRGIRT